MVNYGAKNQRKLTKIKLSQKGMIFKLNQKARKDQTRSFVGEIAYVRTASFLKASSPQLHCIQNISEKVCGKHLRFFFFEMTARQYRVKLELWNVLQTSRRLRSKWYRYDNWYHRNNLFRSISF